MQQGAKQTGVVQETTVYQTSDNRFFHKKSDAINHEERIRKSKIIGDYVNSDKCPYPQVAKKTLIKAIIGWEEYKSSNKIKVV